MVYLWLQGLRTYIERKTGDASTVWELLPLQPGRAKDGLHLP